jgi:tetraacyldisaccharide 4'-kinase
LKEKHVAPFCGIGNPRGFERTVESLGAMLSPMGAFALDDHAGFSEKVLRDQVVPFLRAAREAGATVAVCTQKDAVKFRGINIEEEALMPIYELRVEFRVIQNEDALREALKLALARS